MEAPPNRCPHCNGRLSTSCDMWGRFCLCEQCGFTAEDCAELATNDLGLGSSAIVGDDLPPRLRRRVMAFLNALAGNDLSLAFLDLAQLYRALTTVSGPAQPRAALLEAGRTGRTLIYGENGTVELCEGPDTAGRCPRAGRGRSVPCASRWIVSQGWRFRVALDADACPLVALGLVRPQPAGSAERQ